MGEILTNLDFYLGNSVLGMVSPIRKEFEIDIKRDTCAKSIAILRNELQSNTPIHKYVSGNS